MKVRPGASARISQQRDLLPIIHLLAALHKNLIQMTVSGFKSKAMVHLDKFSEFSLEAGSHDDTRGGDVDSRSDGPHQV